jgi:hypothetical protein
MLNSEKGKNIISSVIRLLVLGAMMLLVAACSMPSFSGQDTAQSATIPCAPGGQVSADLAALQRAVETSPLYTIPAVTLGVAECHVRDESGVMALEYRFKDGGWLHVKRDARIEYTEQEARFTLSLAEDPVAVLSLAEQKAFGVKGCGIDWQKMETQPARDDTNATETVFRGDVCNCQARIRRDAAKHVVGLTIRSAC